MTDIFAISFRLKDSGEEKATYNARYKGLIEEIKKLNRYPDRNTTTSFHLIGSDMTAAGIASDLYLSAHFYSLDELIVINLSSKSQSPAIRGNVPDENVITELLALR